MLIRKNIPLGKISHRTALEDLLPLRQTFQKPEQQTPMIHYPSHTLNPENPISSVLVSQKESHQIIGVEKEDSQFSFKQGGFLNQEDPQHLQQLAFQSPQKLPEYTKQPILAPLSVRSEQKEPRFVGKTNRSRKKIGMITNVRQTQSFNPSISDSSEAAIRKPMNNSLGSSKLEGMLSKIKSLKVAGAQQQSQQSQRYSIMKQDESRIQSTDTSGQESSPIKKSVISTIRKHVERMNLSLARDHRIKQEEPDGEDPSLFFKPTQGNSKPLQEELLQAKNKSFLVRSTNKKTKKDVETIHISYKTSILQLKEICRRYDQSMKVKVAIPAVFSQPIFDPKDSQSIMFTKAVAVFQQLGVASLQPMTIRKYSNCAIVIVDQLSLLSYFSGHTYFGGWRQGNKCGVGLEWMPEKFVYYGQYAQGKREGYGVLKDWQGEVVLGEWRKGRPIQSRKSIHF